MGILAWLWQQFLKFIFGEIKEEVKEVVEEKKEKAEDVKEAQEAVDELQKEPKRTAQEEEDAFDDYFNSVDRD